MSRQVKQTITIIAVAALLWAVYGGGSPFSPAPIPGPGSHVLILFESSDNSSIAHMRVRDSIRWRKHLDERDAEYLVIDVSLAEGQGLGHLDPIWQTAYDNTKLTSLPWIVVSNGKSGTQTTMPDNLDAMMELLARYIP